MIKKHRCRRSPFMRSILAIVLLFNLFILPPASARETRDWPVWFPVQVSPPVSVVRHLAVHPKRQKVVAVAGSRQVFITKDGGMTWLRLLRVSGKKVDGLVQGLEEESDRPARDTKRSRASSIVSLAMGMSSVFVVTKAGLFIVGLDGAIMRARGLPSSGSVTSVDLNPVYPNRIFAASGRRLFVSLDGGRSFAGLTAPFAWPIRKLAVARGPFRQLALLAGQKIFVSTDLGKRFSNVTVFGKVRDMAMVARFGAGASLAVATSSGLLLYDRVTSRGPGRPTKLPGLFGVDHLAAGRPETPSTLWAWGQGLWLADGKLTSFISADLGLDGADLVTVASSRASQKAGKVAAWAATKRRLYRLDWIRVRAGRRRKVAFTGCEGGVGVGGGSRKTERRIRWARWLPRVSLDASVARRRRLLFRSDARVLSSFYPRTFELFVVFTWSLDRLFIGADESQAMRIEQEQNNELTRRMVRRTHTRHRCRKLSLLLEWGQDLKPVQRADLMVGKQWLRSLLNASR